MQSFQLRRVFATLLVSSGLAAVLRAQTSASTPPATKDNVVELNKYVVTGSNLPVAADATDVPVVLIGQSEMQKTGLNSNVLEVLRKQVPAFGGRSNAGNSNATNVNQNTAGGSQIALRNLDTLVLINGRRIATSGVNGVGGKSFVDVNEIPTAAIERVEVLTDGASAIYGSDAVGGVVNIILKSDYQGAEIGGRYAYTSNPGHYSERSAYLVAGAGVGGVHLTATLSATKTDPLWQSQRSFISPNLRAGTSFPGFVSGNYLAPALNSPTTKNPTGTAATAASMSQLIANGTYLAAGDPSIPLFDVAPFETILLRQDQRAAVVSGSADLVPKRLSLFGDYEHSDTKSFNQTSGFLGNLRTVTVPAGAPYNPLNTAVSGVVMGTTATPLQTFNHGQSDRFTLGARGELGDDWNWEAAYTSSNNRLTQRLVNEVYVPNVATAIAGGFDASGNAVAGGNYSKVVSLTTGATVVQPSLDPFARGGVSSAAQANLYGTEVIQTRSKLGAFDAKVVGTPLSIPAGKVAVAIGAATRRETLEATPDQNSYNLSTDPTRHNWGPGTFFDPFSRRRTIDSVFAEVRVPLTGGRIAPAGAHALDLSIAGREEKYSDAGRSHVPKIGARWQPFDEQFTVRFTYSKSFTAPTLYAEYGPPSASLTTADLFFNNLGINDPRLKGVTYYSGNGNNPALQPSTAQSRSLGFALSPKAIKGLTLSVDYTNVTQVGLPAGIGASAIVASVNTLGSASPYFSAISVGGFPGQPGSSQALLTAPQGLYNYVVSPTYAKDIYILDHFVNSGTVKIDAFDINAAYEHRTQNEGKFTVSTAATYLQHFEVQDLPGAVLYEDAGYSTNGKTMSGTLPHWKLYSTIEWEHLGWTAMIGNTYVGSTTDINNGAIPSAWLATHAPARVSSYVSWDAQVGYAFDNPNAVHWRSLRGWRVSLGVNDAFNRMPPLAPLSNAASGNNNNVDVATYSPIGRLWYVAATVKF